jgi:hypothetical protein
MAREVGEPDFADTCRRIFEAGRRNSVERLFNGEYYIQDVDLGKHPDWQYADGCLADQMFGQGWAHQVGLGYLYPKDTVLKTLESIWKYCWAPDTALQNEHHKPARWFAFAGEAGLFTCTWPKSMLTEALAICRAVHERYHPSKRNPFNEIECGDHYARALASWGVLVGLAGFEYHGPKRHLGFAPRITPEDFRAVFTAAEGWGTISQQREDQRQANTVAVQWGRLCVKTLSFALPSARRARRVTINGNEDNAEFTQRDDKITIQLASEQVVGAGEKLQVEIVTSRV